MVFTVMPHIILERSEFLSVFLGSPSSSSMGAAAKMTATRTAAYVPSHLENGIQPKPFGPRTNARIPASSEAGIKNF